MVNFDGLDPHPVLHYFQNNSKYNENPSTEFYELHQGLLQGA